MIISFLDMFAEQFKHCQCRNSSIQALESKPGGYLLFCFAHLSFANTSTSATDLRLTEAKRSASRYSPCVVRHNMYALCTARCDMRMFIWIKA